MGCWVILWVLGYMIEIVMLHGSVFGYMIGVGLHDWCWVT